RRRRLASRLAVCRFTLATPSPFPVIYSPLVLPRRPRHRPGRHLRLSYEPGPAGGLANDPRNYAGSETPQGILGLDRMGWSRTVNVFSQLFFEDGSHAYLLQDGAEPGPGSPARVSRSGSAPAAAPRWLRPEPAHQQERAGRTEDHQGTERENRRGQQEDPGQA